MTGFICVPVEWSDDIDVADFGLLVILQSYADAGGTCWPSQSALAKRTGRTRQWVCLALLRLEKLGRIKVTRRRDGKGGQISSVYSLPTPVRNSDRGCQEFHHPPVRNTDTNYTQDSTTPPHPAREAPRVVPIKGTLPEGWWPSEHYWQKAEKNFPLTDLAAFTEFFLSRIEQDPAQTCVNWGARWYQFLTGDFRKFTKDKANGTGSRYESPFERQQRDARERAAENRRRADDCLARINGGYPRH